MPRTAAASIAPPVEPVVVRTGNVRVLSAAFLGDLQRHYEEKGYKIFDYILQHEPLAYFQAAPIVTACEAPIAAAGRLVQGGAH
jgi:hypothetical protein